MLRCQPPSVTRSPSAAECAHVYDCLPIYRRLDGSSIRATTSNQRRGLEKLPSRTYHILRCIEAAIYTSLRYSVYPVDYLRERKRIIYIANVHTIRVRFVGDLGFELPCLFVYPPAYSMIWLTPPPPRGSTWPHPSKQWLIMRPSSLAVVVSTFPVFLPKSWKKHKQPNTVKTY